MLTEARAFTIEDRDYLAHGDRRLMMRVFRPDGAGPFPAVIELHGGAIELAYVDQASRQTDAGLAPVVDFFKRHLSASSTLLL